jgi:hypothetical protein
MKKIIFTSLILISCTSLIAQKKWMQVLTAPIEKGRLYGNAGSWSIKFLDKKINLTTNEVFSLSQLGIRTSTSMLEADPGKNGDLERITGQLKKTENDYPFYRIKVSDDKEGEFYGLLCFFNADPSKKSETVCKTYELGISDKSYKTAKSGGIGMNYEYYKNNAPARLLGLKYDQVTYLIFISKTDDVFDLVSPSLIVNN